MQPDPVSLSQDFHMEGKMMTMLHCSRLLSNTIRLSSFIKFLLMVFVFINRLFIGVGEDNWGKYH